MPVVPVSVKISPREALQRLADLPWPVLLESARFHPQRGRYSYLSADPLERWILPTVDYGDNPFAPLRAVQQRYAQTADSAGPPFQGGIIGLLSYELGHCWERLPTVPQDDFTTPPLVAGLYDWCLCWDHQTGQLELILPEGELAERAGQARLHALQKRVQSWDQPLTASSLPQLQPTTGYSAATYPDSSCSRTEYEAQVRQVREYIAAGDIYQANLSRKLHYAYPGDPMQLYVDICQINPAPFSAYFRPAGDWAIVSASPEQFLQVQDGHVCTRPIKGTRRRWAAGDLDVLQGAELQASEKDRAENTMIVDLLRNDLSRVCQIGSVRVPRWCELETFERVHHLVSEVIGQLRPECDLWDLLAATFPGGSITGAPKIRAMEIISELEQTARGAYCGSLFAAGWNGSLQSNLLIRTLTWKQGWVQCPVGGGIVADSVPADEYAETVHKSSGLFAKSPPSERGT